MTQSVSQSDNILISKGEGKARGLLLGRKEGGRERERKGKEGIGGREGGNIVGLVGHGS